MSKVIRLEPSHPRDTHRRTGATPPSRLRDTGSSHKKSYPLISYRSLPVDPLGGITGEIEVPTGASHAPPHRTARFLKGPIPLAMLKAAARLPGKALALYIAIQHRCDLAGHATVTVPAALLRDFGLDRDAKARALRELEQACLIQVERTAGRAARITLCEPSPRLEAE